MLKNYKVPEYKVKRMGGSIRNIFWFGLILVLAAAGGVGFYARDYARKNLVTGPAERTNLAVAESFGTNIWIPAMGNIPRPICVPACPDFSSVMAQGRFFFTSLPLVFIQLYDTDGKSLFSIGGSLSDGNAAAQGAALMQQARNQGMAQSVMLDGAVFVSASGTPARGAILRTFVPISTNGQVTEIMEVVTDVTPYWQQAMHLQWASIAFVLLIFGVLYLLTRWSLSRSESIIESQHEEQADLVAAKAKAEEESVEKSKFLANVSHELRTPLNSIIGFSEILKNEVMGPLGSAQYKEYATDIHASGTHLLSLINDILDFSKADANKLEVEFQDTDITKLMQNTLRLVAQRAEAASIKLVSDFSEDHIVSKTDPKRLKQVVLNLLTNAIKFTPPGGSVALTCLKDALNGKMTITVTDTGVGIAEKDISKVMAPFGQVKNEYSSKSEGTGLGLPLTRKLVELMGGQFVITSQLGQGTKIILTFAYTPQEFALAQ